MLGHKPQSIIEKEARDRRYYQRFPNQIPYRFFPEQSDEFNWTFARFTVWKNNEIHEPSDILLEMLHIYSVFAFSYQDVENDQHYYVDFFKPYVLARMQELVEIEGADINYMSPLEEEEEYQCPLQLAIDTLDYDIVNECVHLGGVVEQGVLFDALEYFLNHYDDHQIRENEELQKIKALLIQKREIFRSFKRAHIDDIESEIGGCGCNTKRRRRSRRHKKRRKTRSTKSSLKRKKIYHTRRRK